MKTAVVILNWNGVEFLKQFLPVLVENTPDATLVVVDNASTDDSISFLKAQHPTIRLVINKENGGFAKGYNEGLAELKGEFDNYVLLNSDIEVTAGWLTPLIDKLNSVKSVAGVQPKVLSYHRKDHFEHAGASGGYLDRNFYPFCRGRILDKVEVDTGQYDNETEIFWATGACMAVKADLFHQLGGLDEAFFAHMEEIDFCWRAKSKGYSFYVVPSAVVYHVGGGTLNYQSPKKTYLNFRNSLFMIHKNYQGWLFPKIVYRMGLDGLAGVKFLAGFQFQHLLAILKAHFSYYKHLPSLGKKRRVLKKERGEFNSKGWYKASILWAFYVKRIKHFDGLNKRFFKF